jgi:hypothetical protein
MKLGTVIQIVLTALAFILCAALYCTSLGYIINGLTAALFLVAGLAVSAGLMLLGKIK